MNRFDKFVIYEFKSEVIWYCCFRKLPTTEEIPIIIEKPHKYIKEFWIKETAEYIQNKIHWY